MGKKILYVCCSCRQLHYNDGYNKAEGDLEIIDYLKFLSSITESEYNKVVFEEKK